MLFFDGEERGRRAVALGKSSADGEGATDPRAGDEADDLFVPGRVRGREIGALEAEGDGDAGKLLIRGCDAV